MKRVYSFRALGVGVATKIRFDSVGGERTSPRVLLPAVRLAAGRRGAGSGSAAASGSAGGGGASGGVRSRGGLPKWSARGVVRIEKCVAGLCEVGGRLRAARPRTRRVDVALERGRRRVESARRRRICFERARKGRRARGRVVERRAEAHRTPRGVVCTIPSTASSPRGRVGRGPGGIRRRAPTGAHRSPLSPRRGVPRCVSRRSAAPSRVEPARLGSHVI